MKVSSVSSVQLKLPALSIIKTMTSDDLRKKAQPIWPYYTTFSPSTSPVLANYMPKRTGFSLACTSMLFSLLSFNISFNRFRRQWHCYFKQTQQLTRSTHGQFLRIAVTLNEDDSDWMTAFLWMTDAEFLAIKWLAPENPARTDTETTSCVPAPKPSYPGKTHVYISEL